MKQPAVTRDSRYTSPLSLALLGAAFLLTPGFARAEEQPNVIVILADDLGYADLGCQGSPDMRTPHIDSLAQNGIRFTAGYVTSPQCGPSRAALLTGRYQNRFGFESNEQGYDPGIPPDQPLISERLKEAGYINGAFGKWGVTNRRWGHPPQRGFDDSFWNHDGNRYFPDTPSQYDTAVRRGNDPVDLEEYSTDAFTRAAVEFIEENGDNPFFIYLPVITPHVPMEARPQDLARFPDVEDPLRRTTLAMMANLDDNVGWLLETLRVKGLEEETLIIFLSDNGGYPGNASYNDPFRGTKSQLLEGGIRVPFLMQWKGTLPEGTIYEHPVSSLDIVPTALAAAGMKIQDDWKLDGTNLLPYLKGEIQDPPHEALYWRYNFPYVKEEQHGWAIRQGDWKLVKNGWARTPVALYNLANDPQEEQNLISKQPERAHTMRQKWEHWDEGNQEPAITPAIQRQLEQISEGNP